MERPPDGQQGSDVLLVALCLLAAGALLDVAAVGFFGLDLLVGLLFGAAALLAAKSVLRGGALVWGLVVAATSSLALGVHLGLNFLAG